MPSEQQWRPRQPSRAGAEPAGVPDAERLPRHLTARRKEGCMPRRAGEACSFMAGLRHPLKPGPGQLRAAILASNPEITEHVKWNAPSLRPALPCEQLTTGRLMMIDRSAVATARTARRNATHQAAGRIAVRQTTLAALAAPGPDLRQGPGDQRQPVLGQRPGRRTHRAQTRAAARRAHCTSCMAPTGPPAPAGSPRRSPWPLAEHSFTGITGITAAAGSAVTCRVPAAPVHR